MPYAGKQLMQREVVERVRRRFPNRKVEATAVVLGESKGFIGAWHDNPGSRDCGLFQINIPDRLIDTDAEARLRTASLDPAVYEEVAANNVEAAYQLYTEPWTGRKQRQWQPWVAYTSGWALYPESWVWHREDGQPVGPWVQTGRYLHQAIRAVANWHVFIAKDLNQSEALREAERLADIYGVNMDTHELHIDERTGTVAWKFPPKPSEPGSGHDYPVPNNGASKL